MNKVYLYDGNFKSLLVLVFNLIKFKKVPIDIKSEEDYEPNLIDEPVYINVKLTSKALNNLRKTLPFSIYLRLYYAYLSNDKDKEMIIYKFLNNFLIYKESIINILSSFVNKVIYVHNFHVLFSHFPQRKKERGKKPYMLLYIEAVFALITPF